LSPNGSEVALDAQDQQNDIWLWNFSRQILSRATFDPAPERGAVWTPDGKRIAYSNLSALYWQMADGTGTPEQLTQGERPQAATSFSPDGASLIFHEPLVGSRDLHIVNIDGERTTQPLLGRPFDEAHGDISPDGRWIAYESNESGQREIFVRPFPNVNAGRWQVSTKGGMQPKWSRTGRELFYWLPTSEVTGQLMAASVESRPTFTSRPPQLVVSNAYLTGATGRGYDVSGDGRRFLVIKGAATASPSPAQFVVVLHWTDELKRPVTAR
jgi:Tol biopolymer transport system component